MEMVKWLRRKPGTQRGIVKPDVRRITNYFLLVAFYFQWLVSFSQFNPQSKRIADTFFPELELDISTPAFQKTSGFTNYKEMMDWLDKTIKPHPELATLSFLGESQKGKAIPLLVITQKNNKKKTKVWLQGGLHGDEPAGTESMLFLIHQLLNDPKVSSLLDDLEIAIVPMANIDGYEKQQREAANGMDLNRDQTRLHAPESIYLKTAFSKFQAAVALDFHEYRPYRKHFTRMGKAGITSRYDAMFLYSGNLNVPKVLRDFTKQTFVKNAGKVMDENKLVHHDYLTTQKYGGQVQFNLGSVHSRSSASNFALANCVSTLFEIRGVGIGRMSFKRRVKTSYLIALSYLETAQKEKDTLVKVLQESANAQNKVVVISQRLTRKDSILVIDLASEKEEKMPVVIHDALQSKPSLQRERPQAYLLPVSEKRAVSNLRILGLKIDSLTEEKELEVESYQSDKPDAAEERESGEPDEKGDAEEDADSKQASASTKSIKMKFSKGTYLIYTKQERGNLACEVLEPENANGFVLMKVVKAGSNKEIPIYRYMKQEKLTP